MTPELPWARPVRLVSVPAVAAQAAGVRDTTDERVVVAPGVALPRIMALAATLRTVGTTTVITSLRPLEGQAADRVPTRGAMTSLAGLLADIAGPDGAVSVAVSGTPLRHDVLTALARVPAGTTITYTELAARAGAPRAVRAAARAMATNLVPLLLPCHRIVPAGGGVGRYGWGSDVKAALLALEAADLVPRPSRAPRARSGA